MNILTFEPFGYEGSLVTVETNTRRGIPAVDMVGLSDGAVKEERERIKSAIRNSGFDFPMERVLVSLSPTDLKKEGAILDLAIAASIITAGGKKNTSTRACLSSASWNLQGLCDQCGLSTRHSARQSPRA